MARRTLKLTCPHRAGVIYVEPCESGLYRVEWNAKSGKYWIYDVQVATAAQIEKWTGVALKGHNG